MGLADEHEARSALVLGSVLLVHISNASSHLVEHVVRLRRVDSGQVENLVSYLSLHKRKTLTVCKCTISKRRQCTSEKCTHAGPHLVELNASLQQLHEAGMFVVSAIEGKPTDTVGVLPRVIIVPPDSA